MKQYMLVANKSLRLLRVIVLLLATCAGMACDGGNRDDFAATAMPTETATGRVPRLSAEEEAKVREVIESDSTIAKLAGDAPISIGEVGVWHSGSTKLGGGAEVHLPVPVTGEFGLPSVHTGADTPLYTRRTLHLRVEAMSIVSVLVDLRDNTVAAIRPIGYDHVLDLSTPDPNATPGFPQR